MSNDRQGGHCEIGSIRKANANRIPERGFYERQQKMRALSGWRTVPSGWNDACGRHVLQKGNVIRSLLVFLFLSRLSQFNLVQLSDVNVA